MVRCSRATIPALSRVLHAVPGMLMPISKPSPLLFVCSAVACAAACHGGSREAQVTPPGADTRTETDVLKAGSEVLQSNEPTDKLDVYLVGFHPMKDDPHHQMEAHHYCHQVNEEFAQCALFDSNGANANLNGVEYIISERMFEALPEEEKAFWHPHNYEILSGQLIAPGVPDVAEHALLKNKMNSYGKTWHTWHTGSAAGSGSNIPSGPAMLAWSFNADGEIDPALVESRDRAMRLDMGEERRERQDLVPLAKPQRGVDLLAGAFPKRSKPSGVSDQDASVGQPR